ncbi:MAG: response regulator [Thermodesulfobacteriota bacterium]|nr:response regulator [Thermodesulfobacteriota bacterium]
MIPLSVLVVQNNATCRRILQLYLEKHGNLVATASSGKMALEAVKKKRYHLVLLDLELPEINGIDTAKTIKKTFPDMPVICVTAHALPEHKEICLASGMDAHVPKPVILEGLLKTINRVLSKGKSRHTAPAPQSPARPANVARNYR